MFVSSCLILSGFELKSFAFLVLAARIKKSVPKTGSAKYTTKFKVRCSRYLYTLRIDDPEKAEKLKQSLPPGASQKALFSVDYAHGISRLECCGGVGEGCPEEEVNHCRSRYLCAFLQRCRECPYASLVGFYHDIIMPKVCSMPHATWKCNSALKLRDLFGIFHVLDWTVDRERHANLKDTRLRG